MRLFASIHLVCLALLLPVARAQPAAPPYWTAADLRADVAAVGPNPFAWAPPASVPLTPPPRPTGAVPSNVAHLSLRRPYVLDRPDAKTVERLAVTLPNPFDPDAPPAAPHPSVDADRAADTDQAWFVEVSQTAWDALETAWEKDPVAVRRLFREATGQDWPVTTASGPRAEANRLAAARWVRRVWGAAVRESAAGRKRDLGLKGPVIIAGPVDASLSFVAAGDGGNEVAPALAPRVTGDSTVNRYGVGFLLRLAADVGDRIPWPTLDLSALPSEAAPWAEFWLDEAVRNGIRGVRVTPPAEDLAKTRIGAALEPLRTPNIYLPPPSEVGVLVSFDTATLEPGAWVALFRAHSALRAAGVWPNFVSDEQIRSGSVSLARFRVLVVPAAKWAGRGVMDEIAAWTERGGVTVVSDPHAFTRAEDGWDTAARARSFMGWRSVSFTEAGEARILPLEEARRMAGDVIEQTRGHGRALTLPCPLDDRAGLPAAFWMDLLRSQSVPARPWLENVTAANVRRISGTYSRPSALP